MKLTGLTIKELYGLLGKMIEEHPECTELPVRIFQDGDYDDEGCEPCANNQTINYWLGGLELHSTGNSGYELYGELTLIGEE